jgi:hypothetical protein
LRRTVRPNVKLVGKVEQPADHLMIDGLPCQPAASLGFFARKLGCFFSKPEMRRHVLTLVKPSRPERALLLGPADGAGFASGQKLAKPRLR